MRSIGRRHLLKGISFGATAGLLGPAVTRFISSAHGAEPTAKRMIFLLGGNGWGHQATDRNSEILDTTRNPDGSYTMPPALEPLKPFHAKTSILRRFSNQHGRNLHGNGWGMLTMVPTVNGQPGGISIDRAIARAVGGNDTFDMVHVGIARFGKLGNPVHSNSADGAGKPYPAIPTPLRAYETYFGKTMGKAPGELASLLDQDKSLLDDVCGDIDGLGRKLAGPEKQKIDQLLESCRSLERQIGKRTEGGAAGLRPEPPTGEDADKSGLRLTVVRGHSDVIVNALAFGLTHVGYLSMMGYNDFNDSYSAVGVPGDAHETYSHLKIAGWTKDDYNAGLKRITSWMSGEIAHMMTRLRGFPEAGGTMADSSAAVWMNSGGGKHHQGTDYHAAVVVGDLRGAIKAGKFTEYPGGAHTLSDLFVTLAQGMGVKMDRFGQASDNKGPLTELI